MFSFELQQRPNADADRKHAGDEPLNGAEGEEDTARLRRKQAGLPSGLDGLGYVVGENRRVRCCFARSPSGSAIKSQSS
jgi:hypothetical protein